MIENHEFDWKRSPNQISTQKHNEYEKEVQTKQILHRQHRIERTERIKRMKLKLLLIKMY